MRNLSLWNSNPDSFWGLYRKLNQDMEDLVNFQPACDVEETDSHYLVSFDVPGIAKENIKIELVDGLLTVEGERKLETERRKNSQHLVERSYGKFKRSFSLPAQIDADKVEANYHEGVLRISIAKAESAKPRQIKIKEEKGLFGSTKVA